MNIATYIPEGSDFTAYLSRRKLYLASEGLLDYFLDWGFITLNKLTFLQEVHPEYSRSRPTSYLESVLGKPMEYSHDLKTSPTALKPFKSNVTAQLFLLNDLC